MVGLIISGGRVALTELKECIKHLEGLEEDFLLLGVDKGIEALDLLGRRPDLVMGDFDSVDPEVLRRYQDGEVHRFQAEKDMTDTHIAFDYLRERGCKDVLLFGGTGTRWDHSLANMFLALQYEEMRIRLIDDKNLMELYVHSNETGRYRFEKCSRLTGAVYSYLSIVPTEETLIHKTIGLKYPLEEAILSPFDSYGVSNEMIGEEGEIIIGGGRGFLIQSKD